MNLLHLSPVFYLQLQIYVFPLDSKTAYFKFASTYTDTNVEYGTCEYMSNKSDAVSFYIQRPMQKTDYENNEGGMEHGFKN